MGNILIIDDDETLCGMLSTAVRSRGYDASCAFTIRDGLAKVSGGTFDIVLLDVRMPDGDGLDALVKIRQAPSLPEVIVMTGAGDADDADTAIKSGAWDYIEKPSSLDVIIAVLDRAIHHRQVKKARKPVIADRMGIVGNSAPIRACLDLVAQAAESESNVFITGETGTGKELFAWAIHKNSRRAEKNFVVVDCAALHETLSESALFGHQKGAFTGADKAHEGLISQADGGTLFLDEVGELTLPLQKVFLRVLQEHSFRPLGAKKELKSNFRLVVATNRDLDRMVKAGSFREDLFYRLKSLPIKLPPLRERTEDMEGLVRHHIALLCKRYGMGTKGLAADFLEALAYYEWPGNVRELFSTIERALAAAREEAILFAHHLPGRIRIGRAQGVLRKGKGKSATATPADKTSESNPPNPPTLKEARAAAANNAEEGYLKYLMRITKGDIKKSCTISGLSRPRLYSLLSKYGISRSN